MATPTIDISSYRAKLDKDFTDGRISPREYKRLQTGMGNVAQGQNQGFSYTIDPGSQTFKAEKDGQQARGKIGGATSFNPISGRKTSKAISYITKNQTENPSSALATGSAPAPATNPAPAANAPAVNPASSPRTNGLRVSPQAITVSLFQNPFQKPETGGIGIKGTASVPRFSFAPAASSQANKPTETQNPPVAPPKAPPIAPVAPVKPVVAGNANPTSTSGEVVNNSAQRKLPMPETPVSNPEQNQAESEIQKYYKAISITKKRQPASLVDGAAVYRNKLEELKDQYAKKFGRSYGGNLNWKTGQFNPGTRVPKFADGRMINPNDKTMFGQSGRNPNIDLDGVLNTAMGAYALTSGLTNKSPKVPMFQKLQGRVRPASGDYDSLQRNLNAADSNYGSMVRTMRNQAGSDGTTFIRGLLGANQFRNQAQQQAFGMDSQIRVQDRQREDYSKMAEDQYNNQGANQYQKDKFNWDATRWNTRAQGSQAMLNGSLQYGADRRGNLENNATAERTANKSVALMEGTLRTQVYNEWVRNNGGIPPTEEQLTAEMKKLIPQKPTLFTQ